MNATRIAVRSLVLAGVAALREVAMPWPEVPS